MPPKPAPPASPSVTDSSSGEEEDDEQLSPPSIRPSATAAPKPAAARGPPAAAAAASASSSGEEESSSGEEGDEEESGSGEEETVDRKQPPPPPPTKIPAAESETESGSSDDSDSDANPPTAPRHSARVADPAVKPLASKPMTSAPNPPKPEPSATCNKKRSIPPSPSESGAGQKAFQRIWSDEDEIAILQGLINYNAKHGMIPFTSAGMDPYYDFIHDSLQVDISKSQLYDKLRRLKKKYGNSRARSKGPSPSFSKQHDSVVYELSHKIWGEPTTESENGNAAHGDANRSKSKKRQRVNDEKVEIADHVSEDDDGEAAMLKGRYPYLMEALSGMGDSVQGSIMVKEAMEKIDESKAMALDSKLKKQKVAEARSHMRFMDLKKDSMKLVLDAVEKQG